MKKAINIPEDTPPMIVNLDERNGVRTPTVLQLQEWAKQPFAKLIKLMWSLFLIYGNNLSYILPYLENPFAVAIVSAVIKAAAIWNKRNGTKVIAFFRKKK